MSFTQPDYDVFVRGPITALSRRVDRVEDRLSSIERGRPEPPILTSKIKDHFTQICQSIGADPAEIISRKRSESVAASRKAIAQKLVVAGWKITEISSLLQRDTRTIGMMLKRSTWGLPHGELCKRRRKT